MHISEVTEEAIIFNNGNKITFDHDQDCCEWNYADFSVLNEENPLYYTEFDENLSFESVPNSGFRFGNKEKNLWIFIPCYSEQNGYYTDEIDIYYHHPVLSFSCQYVPD